MKAVILAAGKGTRLGALTKHTPKPMILVAGLPVLEHITKGIAEAGIKNFVYVTKYLAEKIEEYFGNGSKFDLDIKYAPQKEKYGTGAALQCAENAVDSDNTLMTFGDVVFPKSNYANALKLFNKKNCDAVVTLNWVEDPCKGAAVLTDSEDRITDIIEKPPAGEVISHWNSAGLFVFKPIIFNYLASLTPSTRGEYELPDAINLMIKDGLDVRAYYIRGKWRDVGTPEDIPEAEKILMDLE